MADACDRLVVMGRLSFLSYNQKGKAGMKMTEQKKLLQQAIREKLHQIIAEGGSLSCATANQLAQEMGVAPQEIGEMANQLGLRITDCQLGCFGGKKERL